MIAGLLPAAIWRKDTYYMVGQRISLISKLNTYYGTIR